MLGVTHPPTRRGPAAFSAILRTPSWFADHPAAASRKAHPPTTAVACDIPPDQPPSRLSSAGSSASRSRSALSETSDPPAPADNRHQFANLDVQFPLTAP